MRLASTYLWLNAVPLLVPMHVQAHRQKRTILLRAMWEINNAMGVQCSADMVLFTRAFVQY